MSEKAKHYQRWILTGLIMISIGIIVAGAVRYLARLQDNLASNAIQDVMNVTIQQRQSFDGFISRDQDRLHSYVDYFSQNHLDGPEELQRLMTLLKGGDATYAVVCLDEGFLGNSADDMIHYLSDADLDSFRQLSGSGVRDKYIGVISGVPKFSFYETFIFDSGHHGVIQKSYERSTVLENFSLSLYDGQGYGYILNQEGDILLRSVPSTSDRVYTNVFDALQDVHCPQEDIDILRRALNEKTTGSTIFGGDSGQYLYTYMPLESVDGWHLLSIVSADAIRAEGSRMLRDTRLSLELLGLMLVICGVFALLVRRTSRTIAAKNREMAAKNREVAYQTQLFEVFSTYLSNNTNDVYLMMDHDTRKVEYVSPNVERVLGVTRDELFDYIRSNDLAEHPEETEKYYAEVYALTPGGTSSARNTERTNPKTGERKYFLETAYCIDIQGRAKWVSYISDRTRERQDHEALTGALQMAQAANDAKSAFLSSVSHDIRTPMNAIIGFLALMQEETENPAMVKEYAQRIDAASQHLLGLINDVLDMNKIESGSATLSISELNLAEVIDEINTIIRPQTKAKAQTFEIFAAHLNYEHLLGDKLRLNQILINLLSNAVKYTPEGGRIEMRVEELPQVVNNYSRVRFTVSDNGLGMSEEYLKVLFDPFTREETKITHEIQGTGLGMAITKSLVDLMGGAIHVESALGRGSTFTVELELCIQEREDDPKFWIDHKVSRMIVADDDEEACRNIVKAMSKVGVETDYATDGETAIRMMRENREAGRPYDLILLDWKMPNLNGLETARLIRKNYSEKIPILLLTSYDWSDIEQEAIEIGINHFMPKPFFMSTFKEAARRVMGSMTSAERGPSDDVVRGKRILVVDDIEVNRIILVKILSTLGAACGTACDGQEAVDKFNASQPGEYDLILMDVQMPVLNGYEATRAIRAGGHPCAKSVPIIAMTANAFVDDVRDAIQSGMDAHIAKPVQMDKLKATIRQVLDSRKEQAQPS